MSAYNSILDVVAPLISPVCNFTRQQVFSWYQPIHSMKTTLISLFTATLLGFATFANTQAFTAADFIAIAFAAGLVAWTVEQYSRVPQALDLACPIRLPALPAVHHTVKQTARLAA